jgi:hypothetical protein
MINTNSSTPVTFYYRSADDTLEDYKKLTAGAIAAVAMLAVVGGAAALFTIFAGFTLMAGTPGAVFPENGKTNLTFPLVTAGTMVALYQTDTMKEIMNATVAKVPSMLWDWDKMSNTTHEFLTFNVMITLSILAGLVAQGLVYGAIEAKDAHSSNKMRMQ